MEIGEVETAVFAASGMTGDELVVQRYRVDPVIRFLWRWTRSALGFVVSLAQTFEAGENAEHFEAPEILLTLGKGQSLDVSADACSAFGKLWCKISHILYYSDHSVGLMCVVVFDRYD